MMPWKTNWILAPHDPSLPLHAGDREHPPDGYKSDGLSSLGGYPEAANGAHSAYHCSHCGGWVGGDPSAHEVNNLGPLCGRRGVEYRCRRCGEEIGFFGVMS